MQSSTERFVSPLAVARNTELCAWARTLMSVVAGLVAGILGITGAWGFVCYLGAHVLSSLGLLTQMRLDPAEFFQGSSPLSFVTSSLLDNLLLYVVFWALGYGFLWVF